MDYFDQADGGLDLGDDLSRSANFTSTTDSARSLPAEAPGQRLLKWLTWCVITFMLAFGLALATVHTLARTAGMPGAKIFLAQLYSGDYWWHPTDKAYAKDLLREAAIQGFGD